MIHKVAIVIASTNSTNPYITATFELGSAIGSRSNSTFLRVILYNFLSKFLGQKFLLGRTGKRIGCFLPIKYPHDFFVLGGTNIYGKNFEKWNKFLNENSNYEYYMFLHDDCYEFAKGWLDASIKLSKKYDDNILICHQNYSSNGSPGYCYSSGVLTPTNSDEHLCIDDSLVMNTIRTYFKTKALKDVVMKYDSVIGGESCLISNKIAKKLLKYGGIPYPKPGDFAPRITWTPLYERVFSSVVTSLNIKIVDDKLHGQYIFKHNTLI